MTETAELALLRDSVARLLERAGGVGRARTARDRTPGWDSEVLTDLAAAGVLGVIVPEAAGGAGMGPLAAGVIAEAMGRVLAPEPVVPLVGLAAGLLGRVRPDASLLTDVMAGKTVAALAWQGRGTFGRAKPADIVLAGERLRGSSAWLSGVDPAGVILVVAGNPAAPALAEVAVDDPGVRLQPVRQADGSTLHDLHLDGARATILAEGERVADALAAAVADTTAFAAAELLGVSAGALALTLDYLRTREQFGRPIGANQALQHRAVDMHMAQELAMAGLHEALARMEASADARVRARDASRAKARASETARLITREAVQMHGAIGYTDEYDIGLFLNRSLVLSAWLGDAAWHRRHWLSLTESRGDAA